MMTLLERAQRAARRPDPQPVTGTQSRLLGYAPVAGAAFVLALVPLVVGTDGYFIALGILGLVYAGYAIAFNVVFGGSGQLFLCMGPLAGLAGYSSGIASSDLELPLPLTMLAGVVLSTLLGGLFSVIAVRRSLGTIFIGIVTLAFSLAFTTTVQATRDLTGGETGMVVFERPEMLVGTRLAAYYTFLALVAGFLIVHRLIQRSHMGWALRSLRDDEVAARLAGIDVARYKILAGLIGSAMFGAVGALWAHYEGFISPQTYDFVHIDVRVIVMVAFGGIGTLLGPVVGAATFTTVNEILRPVGQLRLAIYGVVLLALFLGFRNGLVPAITGVGRRLVHWRRSRDN